MFYSDIDTASFLQSSLLYFFRVIRAPIGRVYFAGTETATRWTGYMDGAIEAGERAAREVLCVASLLPKDQVWQEEPEFPVCTSS